MDSALLKGTSVGFRIVCHSGSWQPGLKKQSTSAIIKINKTSTFREKAEAHFTQQMPYTAFNECAVIYKQNCSKYKMRQDPVGIPIKKKKVDTTMLCHAVKFTEQKPFQRQTTFHLFIILFILFSLP